MKNNLNNTNISYGMSERISFYNIGTLHAEMDIIRKLENFKNRQKKLDILVFRLSKIGIIGESKPCIHCLNYMKRSNLNICNVYYLDSSGKIVKDMNNCIVTSGMRKIKRLNERK